MFLRFVKFLSLILLILSCTVTATLAAVDVDTAEEYAERLGSGSAQQVLGYMLVLMVLAVMALAWTVWRLFRSQLHYQEKAHAGRDKREEALRDVVTGNKEIMAELLKVVGECHDRTTLVTDGNIAIVKK